MLTLHCRSDEIMKLIAFLHVNLTVFHLPQLYPILGCNLQLVNFLVKCFFAITTKVTAIAFDHQVDHQEMVDLQTPLCYVYDRWIGMIGVKATKLLCNARDAAMVIKYLTIHPHSHTHAQPPHLLLQCQYAPASDHRIHPSLLENVKFPDGATTDREIKVISLTVYRQGQLDREISKCLMVHRQGKMFLIFLPVLYLQ